MPVHYLRPNHAEWTPAAVIVVDTETRVVPGSDPEVLTLRLWSARFVDRRDPRNGERRDIRGHGYTTRELVEWIEQACKGRTTVWLFCHNLSFDLVTTRLPLVLAEHGWEITDAAIGGKAPWIRMAKDRWRLALVDSWSWLPRSAADIAHLLGLTKVALPKDSDTAARWRERCDADVDIIVTAMCQLMDWWDRNNLGRWTISGAACGWNAMRHTPTAQRITINPEPEGIAADRAAIHGGRRSVWRVGTQRLGPFLELDFVAAYPSIAAHMPLPIGRKRPFASLPVNDRLVEHERWGIIAQCTVTTTVPRWPVRVAGASWFPVGTFTTTLAGPEIAEARRLGCLVSIGPGYVHQLGTAMSPWAHWCLATQRGEGDDTPPAAVIAAKAWGRSVIGKWAAHAFDKIELGPAPSLGWSYEEGFDHESQSRGGTVDLAGRRWWVWSSGEGDNSYPGVLAWVESAVRARLSRCIEAIGAGCVVQCDTDGLIINERLLGTRAAGGHLIAPDGMPDKARTAWVLNCLDPVLAPLIIRVKRTVAHVTVIGPQHLDVGGQRRFSGIPSGAVQTDVDTYTGRTWPKLQWQMQHGSPAGYVRPTVTSVISGPYVAGWVTTSGRVVPAATELDATGSTVLLPWGRTPGRRRNERLTDGQHAALDILWR